MKASILAYVLLWGMTVVAAPSPHPQSTHDQTGWDPRQLRDITGIEKVEPPTDEGWTWKSIVIAAVAVGTTVVGWALWRRPRIRLTPLPGPWALAELDRLSAGFSAENGCAAVYHAELAHVLRTYLDMRFGSQAPKRTTVELLADRALIQMLTASQRETLEQILGRADMAKFARMTPSAEDCVETGQLVRRFVGETMSAPEKASPVPLAQAGESAKTSPGTGPGAGR
jgi:hypothetical protein